MNSVVRGLIGLALAAVAALTATVLAVFSAHATEAQSAAANRGPVHGYIYDSHQSSRLMTYIDVERGPPATDDRYTPYDSVSTLFGRRFDAPGCTYASRCQHLRRPHRADARHDYDQGASSASRREVPSAPPVASVAANAGGDFSQILLRSPRTQRSKFKHAGDFGVAGNYSKADAAEFRSAINQHINAAGMRAIQPRHNRSQPEFGLTAIAARITSPRTSRPRCSGWTSGSRQAGPVLLRQFSCGSANGAANVELVSRNEYPTRA